MKITIFIFSIQVEIMSEISLLKPNVNMKSCNF